MRQSWFNLIQRETGADRQILCASIEHQIVTSIGEHQRYGRCSLTRATFAATRDMQADAIFICILTGQARQSFEMDTCFALRLQTFRRAGTGDDAATWVVRGHDQS